MPRPKPKTVTAWSYSRWSQYDQCPYMLKLSAIDKAPTEQSYPLIRGNKIHKIAESFLLGKITGMPDELKKFDNEFRSIKRHKAVSEMDLSVDKSWGPSHGKDWDNVWCRSYLDAVIQENRVVTIIDYKTGRVYEKTHRKQGSLYATCAFAHFPEVNEVQVEFWYLDQGEVLDLAFSRDEWSKLKTMWNRRANPIMRERAFKPNPGESCDRCFHNPKRGGTCKYAE